MKKYIIVLLVATSFTFCKTSKPSQDLTKNGLQGNTTDISVERKNISINDTANLVTEIVKNKKQYVDKPLSVLLSDLKIPIVSYHIINLKLDSIIGIRLAFETNQQVQQRYGQRNVLNSPHVLFIYWQKPIPTSTYNEIRQKSLSTGNIDWNWGDLEKSFYSKHEVRDISLIFNL